MNKKQEIKKMQFLIVNDILLNHNAEETAEHLHNHGIGDKKQAVKEFKNMFWNKICIELNDILGQNPPLRIEIKQHIKYVLCEIFTELYGEKEKENG